MFRSLTYSVTFPDTGRTLAADLEFEPDYYAIVGSNETGKTMILEMLRFALFGTMALRGVADDYKTLTVACEFTLKNVPYSVERTIKSATLSRGDEVVASGVTTVNEKIGQLLGFGLPVFDVACSINQGEVERLGSMTAGERKRLVDGVLGIDTLDIVAKWGMEEARLLTAQAEGIKRGLVAPETPAMPEGYIPSSSIDLEQLRAAARELAELRGFLSQVRSEPVKPECPTEMTVAELEPLAEQQRAQAARIASLKATIAALPEKAPEIPDDIDAQWEKYEALVKAQRWLEMNPKPRYAAVDLCQWQLDLQQNLEWAEHEARQQELNSLRHQLEHADKATCPNCDHVFPLDAAQAEKIKAMVAELEAQPAPREPAPPMPPLRTMDEIRQHMKIFGAYDWDQYQAAMGVPPAARPAIERHLIPVLRAQIAQAAERADYIATLSSLSYDPEPERLLAQRRAYEAALQTYTTAYQEWMEWVSQVGAAQSRAAELAHADEILREMEQRYREATDYEAAVRRFEAEIARVERAIAEVNELEAMAAKHRKVKELMAVLRSLIKQHLMPSLNKVSSHLLRQMTGGQRNLIYVDEDFNVMVDNQRLETLSGSGKACTNLAIRIALGQVLTNKVFSVLLADEIDASMDNFRAQNTSEVFDTLRNSISQILLVSHKPIEADNVIELGASIESRETAEGAV